MSRVWEGLKTALIILLFCSAMYLAVSLIGELTSGQSLSHRIGTALGWIPAELPYTQRSEHYAAAAMPLTISMTSELGRGSTQGDVARTAELYNALSRHLGEALANASMPIALEAADWRAKFSGESATLLYAGDIPLESLAHWLGAAPSEALEGLRADNLTLCVDGNQVVLLLRTEHWLCLGTGIAPEGLRQVLALCRPDGSVFAMEDEHYARIDPLSLITVSTSLPVVEASNPLADGDRIDAAATLLGLNPYRDTAYTSANGTITITGSSGRLKVTSAGVLDYTASSEAASAATDDTALIESARGLLAQLSQDLLGDASLHLSGLSREDSTLHIYFDYVLEGYPIRQSGGSAAEVIYEAGRLRSLRWNARCYTATDETQSLLSARQAAAIVAEGAQLKAAYVDAGGSVACGWLE